MRENYLFRFLKGLTLSYGAILRSDTEEVSRLCNRVQELIIEPLNKYLEETEDLPPERRFPPLYLGIITLIGGNLIKNRETTAEDISDLLSGLLVFLAREKGISPEELMLEVLNRRLRS